ncbi:MAG: DUF4174 domain-containing protein [Pseudomonadota bacterium]
MTTNVRHDRRRIMAWAGTLTAVAGLAPLGLVGATRAEAMARYRWKNRPLLVFAPSTDHPMLRRQKALLAGRTAGLRDRDMVVIYIVGSSVSARLGRAPGLSAAALRRRFGVAPGAFRAVLVGKDTGAKISSARPLSTVRLFGTIDAMPMRRREMRQRGS